MQEPRRQIPQAIVTGGIVIAAIYLFSAFGIGAAVPVRDISPDSGLIDAVSLMTGGAGGTLVRVVALLFLVTLFGNMISWSMGVNSTAALRRRPGRYAGGVRPALEAQRYARGFRRHQRHRGLCRVPAGGGDGAAQPLTRPCSGASSP